jgi:trimeric autotransporter adhesin
MISAVTMLAVFSGCGGGTSVTTPPPATLSSIQVTGVSAVLTAGSKQQMTATGTYSDGSQKDLTGTATWSSSNTSFATVAPGGLVTAVASGALSITAKIGSVSGASNLTVTVNVVLVSVAVTPANPAVAPGTKEQFIATGSYSDGTTQNLTGSATWSSSNTVVATISTTLPTQGLAKTLAAGSSTITATSGTVSGSTALTVTSAVVTSISVSPVNANIPLGISQQYSAAGTFSDGSVQDVTGVVTWKSSATGVASITVSGLATGLNIGTSNISATLGTVSGSAPLTVNAANLASLAITPANGTIAQGTTVQLTATGTFNDGGTRNLTRQAVWTSSDTTVAMIGAGTGIAVGQPRTGLGPGTTVITATLGTVSVTVNLTVTDATVSSITVTPSGATIPIGSQKGFTAIGLFSDSSTQDITANCHWTSSNTAVATVGSGGGSVLTATGLSSGSTNINASFGGVSGLAPLTVNSATLVSLTLTAPSAILAPGSSLSINAMGTFSDGGQRSVNGAATWTSSDAQVATVAPSGTATGQSAGIAVIKAQVGTISGTVSLVVEGSSLASLQVSPASFSIPASLRTGITATGMFANGDSLDLTGIVAWTSSAPSVATVSNAPGSQGTATGLTPGSTTISAVFAEQAGRATLTVTNATLVSISVTPASMSISPGSAQQFKAVGTFSDGFVLNITSQANWDSSDIAVATVNAAGLASSAGSGSTTITASLNGVSGNAILTVQ